MQTNALLQSKRLHYPLDMIIFKTLGKANLGKAWFYYFRALITDSLERLLCSATSFPAFNPVSYETTEEYKVFLKDLFSLVFCLTKCKGLFIFIKFLTFI